ncbi:hypothetical protein [Streptomyces sp. NPDC048527]|uniref:hypothetical protein n=1 Tax=Streptomyces sp. NPDC048527 TaxID=3365568 RepID=UPI003710A0C8
MRIRRDRRDPLVIFFALGAVVHVAGGVTDHTSWGRVLPAVFVLAQSARGGGGAAYGSYPVAAGHPEYFLPNEARRADLAVRQVATSLSGEVLLRLSDS